MVGLWKWVSHITFICIHSYSFIIFIRNLVTAFVTFSMAMFLPTEVSQRCHISPPKQLTCSATENIFSQTNTGWWFGTFFIFPYIGNVILPTDELHHFSEG
jgi:hypothetical protein